jgi:hypothetical protein
MYTNALWDTGATGCVITEKLAKELALYPIASTYVDHAGGRSLSNVYMLNLWLPNQVGLEGIRFTEFKHTTGSFDVIVGMDVITLGDFAITHKHGKTLLTYQLPSFANIDFVKDNKKAEAQKYKNIGRNQPCPCKSGKKFKDCHETFFKENR